MAPSNDFIRLPLLKCERASINRNRFAWQLDRPVAKSFRKNFIKYRAKVEEQIFPF